METTFKNRKLRSHDIIVYIGLDEPKLIETSESAVYLIATNPHVADKLYRWPTKQELVEWTAKRLKGD